MRDIFIKDPSVTGFLFESMFFACIKHDKLSLTDFRTSQPVTGFSNDRIFDWDVQHATWEFKHLNDGGWLRSMLWNHGAFDAVYVEPAAEDPRQIHFFQVTRAQKPSLNHQSVISAFNALQNELELISGSFTFSFVIPSRSKNSFTSPAQPRGFPKMRVLQMNTSF